MSPVEAEQPKLDLLNGYAPPTGVYDEMVFEGTLRPHWHKLVQALEKLEVGELMARRDTARRILSEHGVTYNVYGDTRGLSRPWALDLVPLMIAPDEWRMLSAGLIQRAQLLNLVLADFYGSQRLIKEGALPAASLYGNPAFLRPCHGINQPRGIFLFLHAVDLARSANGEWRVLSDRTQAPSGAGYALENRVVLAEPG